MFTHVGVQARHGKNVADQIEDLREAQLRNPGEETAATHQHLFQEMVKEREVDLQEQTRAKRKAPVTGARARNSEAIDEETNRKSRLQRSVEGLY